MEYSKQEERLLIRSGDAALTKRMKKAAVVIPLSFALLLIGAAAASRNVWIILAVSLAYILITLMEKVAYVKVIAAYRELIVKLSTRINELEKKG